MSEKSLQQLVEDHLCASIPQGLANCIRHYHEANMPREEILARLHRAGATRQTITGLMCEAYLDRLLRGQTP